MLDKSTLEQETQNAIEWIRKYVEKIGANGIVIGNSGGKDSATVLAMAVEAIGKEKVLSVAMPCFSKQTDLEDAKLVAEAFEVPILKVDLSNTYQEMENEINCQIPQSLTQEAMINIKPRLRMTTLYSIAQTLGYLVIGTGNLCEAMVGYTTKWGDNSSDFNPIGNFTVEEVFAIGKMLGVPEKILQKVPSDGLGGQTDEEKMGIQYSQVAEMIETGTTDETAKQEIIRRYQVSKHKRRTVPIYTFERKNYLLEL
ncbi:MAG: NAD(+) synthase [Clostridia bacterium]|nr:NAD(+) synthase [Clostridia bacterium]